MQFAYSQPTPLRLLDEANFWKHQEQEHTLVIREIIPDLERKFIEELKEWEMALTSTHGEVIRLTETYVRFGSMVPPELPEQVLRLISYCLEQSARFVKFLFEIMNLSPAAKKDPVAISVIRHQIRESEYFIGIVQTICNEG